MVFPVFSLIISSKIAKTIYGFPMFSFFFLGLPKKVAGNEQVLGDMFHFTKKVLLGNYMT